MKTHSKQRKGESERWDRKIGRGREALQKQTMNNGRTSEQFSGKAQKHIHGKNLARTMQPNYFITPQMKVHIKKGPNCKPKQIQNYWIEIHKQLEKL